MDQRFDALGAFDVFQPESGTKVGFVSAPLLAEQACAVVNRRRVGGLGSLLMSINAERNCAFLLFNRSVDV